jgi:hypothetical protein
LISFARRATAALAFPVYEFTASSAIGPGILNHALEGCLLPQRAFMANPLYQRRGVVRPHPWSMWLRQNVW